MYQKFKRLSKRTQHKFTAVKNVFDSSHKMKLVLICETIQELTQANQVLISVVDGESLITRAAVGINLREQALSASPAAALIGDTENDSILVSRSELSGEAVDFFDEIGAQCFFGYKVKGTPKAIISLYSAKPDFYLSEQQSRTLYNLARIVSVELEDNQQSSVIELEALQEHRDPITGLNTYEALNRRIQKCRSTDTSPQGTLVVLKPLNFNRVNRLYGRSGGNQVLQEITRRLKTISPKASFIARLHGNRFGILLPDTGHSQIQLESYLKHCLSKPFKLDELEVPLNFAIGNLPIDLFQPISLRNLLDWADSVIDAIKVEKHYGVTVVNFSKSLHNALAEEAYLEKALHHALNNDELFLVYQPIVRTSDGNVVAAETLVRWKHQGALIEPLKFVTLAESSGLISSLTKWVVDRACQEFSTLRDAYPNMRLALNLSGQDIVNHDLYDVICDATSRHHMDCAALRLELTEHSMVEHFEHAINSMEKLSRLGIRFALDDFGTGHSSLKYLQELPITIVKIDKSFVANMLTCAKSMSIIRTIVAMASSLGLDVIAEGVETENQYLELKSLGVAYVQGWYLGKPKSVDEFVRSQ